MDTVFLKHPHLGVKEVEAKPEVLVPLMTAGWTQSAPPPVIPAIPQHSEEESHGG